jgi:hypothetical protein
VEREKRIGPLQPMQIVKGDQNVCLVRGGVAGPPFPGIVSMVYCPSRMGGGRQFDKLSPYKS